MSFTIMSQTYCAKPVVSNNEKDSDFSIDTKIMEYAIVNEDTGFVIKQSNLFNVVNLIYRKCNIKVFTKGNIILANCKGFEHCLQIFYELINFLNPFIKGTFDVDFVFKLTLNILRYPEGGIKKNVKYINKKLVNTIYTLNRNPLGDFPKDISSICRMFPKDIEVLINKQFGDKLQDIQTFKEFNVNVIVFDKCSIVETSVDCCKENLNEIEIIVKECIKK